MTVSKRIIVGSTNPVKIDATRIGFINMFKHDRFEVSGVAVPSEVSDQPIGETETLRGAYNRARNAQREVPDADYHIGIEGGIEHLNDELVAFAWIVVLSGDKIGKAKTGGFILPQEVSNLVKQGIELGEADDIVFKRTDSKQKSGSVGILTGDVITRTDFYSHAVTMALIPFKRTDLTFSNTIES